MIKLTHIVPAGPAAFELTFSDGSHGRWSAEAVIAANTELTRPLADPGYFARAFNEAGALSWPNGLEFSAWTLQADLREAGALVAVRAA